VRVLVSVDSRHGSTEEIASAIAAELLAAGLEVDAVAPGDVTTLDPYGGVVLGSAIYMGSWMPAVKQFIERHKEALRAQPVWLFSSGPTSDQAKPSDDPAGEKLLPEINAREHRVFSGKLDRSQLSMPEKLVMKAVRAPEGDFRDWPAIRDWAKAIAQSLKQSQVAGAR
jgi:menaquinone-dependent protoporphyrinogen oxidase